MLPSIPQLPMLDPTSMLVIGIAVAAYLAWFLWGVLSHEFNEDEWVKARKPKP